MAPRAEERFYMAAFLLVLSSMTVVQAEAPDAARVKRLIWLLDDEQLANRQAAEKELVAMGTEVLSLLPPLTTQTSPEVKERLSRITRILQTQLAEQFAEGARVTLRGQMPLAEAFAALEEQTGNRAFGFELCNMDVQVDWKDLTYWQAVDDLLDQAKLTVEPFGSHPNAVDLASRTEDQIPRRAQAVYRGPFRLEPQFVRSMRDLQRPTSGSLQLRTAITWEPRIAPISFSLPLSSIQAVDNQGRSVPVTRPGARLNFPVEFSVGEAAFDIPFALPARDAKCIAKLQGTLLANVPGRTARFEFAELDSADGQQQRQAGVTVTLVDAGKNEDLYELRVRVHIDNAGDALASHRGWIYKNDAYLIKDDRRSESIGSELKAQATDSFAMAYYFALDDELSNYRFIYETPALVVEVKLPFEMKDIALP
jgi:hypothetical protein